MKVPSWWIPAILLLLIPGTKGWSQDVVPVPVPVEEPAEKPGLRPKKLIGKLIPGSKKRQERKQAAAATGNDDGAVVIPNPANANAAPVPTAPSSIPVVPVTTGPAITVPSNPVSIPGPAVPVAEPQSPSRKGILNRMGNLLPGKDPEPEILTEGSESEETRKGLLGRFRARREGNAESLDPGAPIPAPAIPVSSRPPNPVPPTSTTAPGPAPLATNPAKERLTIPAGSRSVGPSGGTALVSPPELPQDPSGEETPMSDRGPTGDLAPTSSVAANESGRERSGESTAGESLGEEDAPPASGETTVSEDTPGAGEPTGSVAEVGPMKEAATVGTDAPGITDAPLSAVTSLDTGKERGATAPEEGPEDTPRLENGSGEKMPGPSPSPGLVPVPSLAKVSPEEGSSRLVFEDTPKPDGESLLTGTARFVAIREGVRGVMTSLRGNRQSAPAGTVFRFVEREEDVVRVKSSEGMEGRIEAWQLRDATFDEAVEFLKVGE